MADNWGPLMGMILGPLLGIGLLLLVIMLPLSYTYVEFDQIAFKKSTIDNKVDISESYASGRYFWGLSTTAVSFPSVYQRVALRDDDLVIFASLGSEFNIECDVYYKLEKDKLPFIFEQFGLNYHERFEEAIKASIKNTAPEFTVDDYIRNRHIVSETFLTKLHEDMLLLNVDIQPYKFVLLDIEFPPVLQQNFLDTAVQEQLNNKAIYQQEVDLIEKTTQQLLEEIAANKTQIVQNGTATADVLIRNARAEADKIRMESVGEGIATLFAALEITSSSDRKALFDLLTVLDSVSSPQLIVGDVGNIIINRP